MYVLIGILQVKIAYVMRNVSGQLCYFKGPGQWPPSLPAGLFIHRISIQVSVELEKRSCVTIFCN